MTGSFLDRWSRRKRAAESGPEAPGVADTDGAGLPEAVMDPASASPDPAPSEGDEALDEALIASLPRIEDITAQTDIRVFLQKGVPQALRNAALRRAWSADPLIAGYEDPARDYFWDWNAPGGVPGGGGILDPERVARMARDIAGKVESAMHDSDPAQPPAGRPDPAEPAVATATVPPEPAVGTTDDTAASDPVPAAKAGPVPASDPGRDIAKAPSGQAEPPASPDRMAQEGRRRHGGAIPG